ncbi:unnamed protein product [Schistosoma intercalatum]|nr:unnamed protein product [Schistosoma intercalatum]
MSALFKRYCSVFSRSTGSFHKQLLNWSFVSVGLKCINNGLSLPVASKNCFSPLGMSPTVNLATLAQMAISGPFQKKRPPNKAMNAKPFIKGIVLKTFIRKPKKPNSANRKCDGYVSVNEKSRTVNEELFVHQLLVPPLTYNRLSSDQTDIKN